MKVPKKWKYWCEDAGFVLEDPDGSYFMGRGRHWRICEGCYFQASERYETFGRWANSVVATYSGKMPKTFEEFLILVDKLEDRCLELEELANYARMSVFDYLLHTQEDRNVKPKFKRHGF